MLNASSIATNGVQKPTAPASARAAAYHAANSGATPRSGAELWKTASWKVKLHAALRKKTVLFASHAAQLRAATARAEPGMTALLQALSSEFGGELVGLENRFKTPEALVEKIGRDVCAVRASLSLSHPTPSPASLKLPNEPSPGKYSVPGDFLRVQRLLPSS
jgi:hypothetical protein